MAEASASGLTPARACCAWRPPVPTTSGDQDPNPPSCRRRAGLILLVLTVPILTTVAILVYIAFEPEGNSVTRISVCALIVSMLCLSVVILRRVVQRLLKSSDNPNLPVSNSLPSYEQAVVSSGKQKDENDENQLPSYIECVEAAHATHTQQTMSK